MRSGFGVPLLGGSLADASLLEVFVRAALPFLVLPMILLLVGLVVDLLSKAVGVDRRRGE